MTPLRRSNMARDALRRMRGQVRLSELRENYHGQQFEKDVIRLVEDGDITLEPVGDVTTVQTIGCRTKHYPD